MNAPIQVAAQTNMGPFQQVKNFIRDRLVQTMTVTICGTLLLNGVSAWNIWQTHNGWQQQVSSTTNPDRQAAQRDYQQQSAIALLLALLTLTISLASWSLVLVAVRERLQTLARTKAALSESQAQLAALDKSLPAAIERQPAVDTTNTEPHHQDAEALLAIVRQLESGDLTVRAQVSDRPLGKIGTTLNRMVDNLAATVARVASAAHQLASEHGSRERLVAAAIEHTTAQSESVGRVLSLTETISQSAQTATAQLQATQAAIATLQATVGEREVTIGSLDREIATFLSASDRIVQQIKTLGEFIGLSDKFVYDQSEIATQTQVLALNAALVASRAAEQRDPKQFAAVASEFEWVASQVSQLAQQTNEGLTSLEQRNSQIQRVVADVDREVQSLGGTIDNFTQGVAQTKQVFATVQTATERAIATTTAAAATSQTIGHTAAESTEAIATITALTERLNSQAQSARTSALQMSQMSAALVTNIQAFKLPESVPSALPALNPAPVQPNYQLN